MDDPHDALFPEAEPEPSGDASGDPEHDAEIVAVLQSIFDPEIPVNIYELGLIYGVERDDSGDVTIRMTLTSPNCPVAESLPKEVQDKVAALDSVASAKVDLVWDPPWSPDQMSEEAKLELGLW